MRSKLLAIIALVWFLLVISAYFVYHKPFNPEAAINWLKAIVDIGLALAVISLCGGIGRRLFPGESQAKLLRATLQAALGMGVLSLGILAVGALGGFRSWLFVLVSFLIILATYQQIYQWWADWGGILSIWNESDRFGRTLGIGVVLLLLIVLSVALAPPVKFDALVYHLALPRRYLEAGELIFTGENVFWGMPQIGEILYTFVIGLGKYSSAATLGWAVGALCLLGILAYLTDRFGTSAGWVGVVSILSGITLSASLAWGYVDWFAALFGWAFLVVMGEWIENDSKKYLRIGGVFTGFAIGAKYTAGILFFSGMAIVVWHMRKRALMHILRQVLRFSAWVMLAALPWFLKNYLASGNPVFPFIFPTEVMDELRLIFYQNRAAWGGWQDVLLLPLRATLIGVEGSPGYSASIGPLMLAFAGLFWLGWKGYSRQQKTAIVAALWIVGPALFVWMIGSRIAEYMIQSRLYFAIFPAVTVLVASSFKALTSLLIGRVRVGTIARVMILMVLILILIETWSLTIRQGGIQRLSGLQTDQEYLVDNLGWHILAMQAIDNSSENERVMMLWEPRGFYCQSNCDPDEVLDRWWWSVRQLERVEAVLENWGNLGYTHVLLYRQGMNFIQSEDSRYRDEDWKMLEELLAKLPEPVEFGDAYELYSLIP